MKKILFLMPNSNIGSPAYERTNAFCDFYIKQNFEVYKKPYPASLFQLFLLVCMIYSKGIDCIFVSQPPFEYSIIFAIPFLKKIIDYRDGWSIAIKDGYGGLVKPNIVKSLIAKYIELFCIKNSVLTITCTPGLHKYLSSICSNKTPILLIPNGISQSRYDLIKSISENSVEKKSTVLKFYCAGKFSEYGVKRAKNIINLIRERYPLNKIEINLIGSDYCSNKWIEDLVDDNFKFNFFNRMNKNELYTELNKADIFLTVVRDEQYELGTKVYEYIAFGKPVFNYFSEVNQFVEYFDGAFDVNNVNDFLEKEIVRENLININRKSLLDIGVFR